MSILRVLPLLPATSAISLQPDAAPVKIFSDFESGVNGAFYKNAMTNPYEKARETLEQLAVIAGSEGMSGTYMSGELYQKYGEYQNTFCTALLYELLQDPAIKLASESYVKRYKFKSGGFLNERDMKNSLPEKLQDEYEKMGLNFKQLKDHIYGGNFPTTAMSDLEAQTLTEDAVKSAFEAAISDMKERTFEMKAHREFPAMNQHENDTVDKKYTEGFHLCNGLHPITRVDHTFCEASPVAYEQLLRVIYKEGDKYRSAATTGTLNMVKLQFYDFWNALVLFSVNMCDQSILQRLQPEAASVTTTNVPICLMKINSNLCLKVAASHHRFIEIVEKNKSIKRPDDHIALRVTDTLKTDSQWKTGGGRIYFDDFEFGRKFDGKNALDRPIFKELTPKHPAHKLIATDDSFAKESVFYMKAGMPKFVMIRDTIAEFVKRNPLYNPQGVSQGGVKDVVGDALRAACWNPNQSEYRLGSPEFYEAMLEEADRQATKMIGDYNEHANAKNPDAKYAEDLKESVAQIKLLKNCNGLILEGGPNTGFGPAAVSISPEASAKKAQYTVTLLTILRGLCPKLEICFQGGAVIERAEGATEDETKANIVAARKANLREDTQTGKCPEGERHNIGSYTVPFPYRSLAVLQNRDNLVCQEGKQVAPECDIVLKQGFQHIM